MAIWFGTKVQGGDTSVGTEDLIQDNYFAKYGNYVDTVKLVHLNFFCEQDCEVKVDDNDSQWFDAGTEIEFTTEYDLQKMPEKNFKILTSGVTYSYTIIIKK